MRSANVQAFQNALRNSIDLSKFPSRRSGYYDDPTKAPSSPWKLGEEIQSDSRSNAGSKITDINTVSVSGRVIGFLYRTQNGHMAIQEAVPGSTVTNTKGNTRTVNLGFSKVMIGNVAYARNTATATSMPNQGEVVPLTDLSQLPKNSYVQPLDGTHSSRLLAASPHDNVEKFQQKSKRPDAFTYRFSRVLPRLHGQGRLFSIDRILHVRRGENVTITNGTNGLEVNQAQQQQQHHQIGRG